MNIYTFRNAWKRANLGYGETHKNRSILVWPVGEFEEANGCDYETRNERKT